jgi:hypothetical protein
LPEKQCGGPGKRWLAICSFAADRHAALVHEDVEAGPATPADINLQILDL